MLVLVICLAVLCLILLLALIKQDDKNTELEVENSLMRGRIETLQECGDFVGGISSVARGQLTVEDVEAAVRHAGYVPHTSDNRVLFMVGDSQFYIDLSRLPLLLICWESIVQTSERNMELLKKAAHLASDGMIMVKAIFNEEPDSTTLNFCVAAMDRNYLSFRDNLMTYIDIISEGTRRMLEIYNQLVEEKKTTPLAGTPFAAADVQDKKLPS